MDGWMDEGSVWKSSAWNLILAFSHKLKLQYLGSMKNLFFRLVHYMHCILVHMHDFLCWSISRYSLCQVGLQSCRNFLSQSFGEGLLFCCSHSTNPKTKWCHQKVKPRKYLSPDALVLLCFQKVEQHLQQRRVLPVGLHHIASTSHLLAQSPQRHLVDETTKVLPDLKSDFTQNSYYSYIRVKKHYSYYCLVTGGGGV